MIARLESHAKQRPLWLQAQSEAKKPAVGGIHTHKNERWLLSGITAVFLLWLSYHRLIQPAWLQEMPGALQELMGLSEIAGVLTLGLVWFVVKWRRLGETAVDFSPPTNSAQQFSRLYELTPREFEEYVAQLFREKGYRVQLRGRSGDRGVDLELIHSNGRRAIVQCKRYRSTVGPDIIRELYGTLIHERVAHAFLVTTADISVSARQWAEDKPLTLIDGQTLAHIASAINGPKQIL